MDVSGPFKNLGDFLDELKEMSHATLDINSMKLSGYKKSFTYVQAHIPILYM